MVTQEKFPSLLMLPLLVIIIYTHYIYALEEFHLESNPGHYDLDIKNQSKSDHRILSGDELVDYYLELIKKFPSKLLLYNMSYSKI